MDTNIRHWHQYHVTLASSEEGSASSGIKPPNSQGSKNLKFVEIVWRKWFTHDQNTFSSIVGWSSLSVVSIHETVRVQLEVGRLAPLSPWTLAAFRCFSYIKLSDMTCIINLGTVRICATRSAGCRVLRRMPISVLGCFHCCGIGTVLTHNFQGTRSIEAWKSSVGISLEVKVYTILHAWEQPWHCFHTLRWILCAPIPRLFRSSPAPMSVKLAC